MKTKKVAHLKKDPIHKPNVKIRANPPFLPEIGGDKSPLISMCGHRGSGKSMTTTNLLQLYNDYPQPDGLGLWDRCFVISPTYEENLHYWKFLPIDEEGGDVFIDPTISAVNNIVARIDEDMEEYKEWKENVETAKKAMKKFLDKGVYKLSEEELILLYSINFKPEELEWKYSPRKTPPCFLLIIDDCSHSKIYSNSGTNKFSNLTLRNRHKNCTIAMLNQSYKTGVPKFLRQGNLSILCLWKVFDKKLIDDIYNEVSNDLTIDEWKKMFKYATDSEDGHSHLTIMFDLPKNEGKYRKNLDEIIIVDQLNNFQID